MHTIRNINKFASVRLTLHHQYSWPIICKPPCCRSEPHSVQTTFVVIVYGLSFMQFLSSIEWHKWYQFCSKITFYNPNKSADWNFFTLCKSLGECTPHYEVPLFAFHATWFHSAALVSYIACPMFSWLIQVNFYTSTVPNINPNFLLNDDLAQNDRTPVMIIAF